MYLARNFAVLLLLILLACPLAAEEGRLAVEADCRLDTSESMVFRLKADLDDSTLLARLECEVDATSGSVLEGFPESAVGYSSPALVAGPLSPQGLAAFADAPLGASACLASSTTSFFTLDSALSRRSRGVALELALPWEAGEGKFSAFALGLRGGDGSPSQGLASGGTGFCFSMDFRDASLGLLLTGGARTLEGGGEGWSLDHLSPASAEDFCLAFLVGREGGSKDGGGSGSCAARMGLAYAFGAADPPGLAWRLESEAKAKAGARGCAWKIAARAAAASQGFRAPWSEEGEGGLVAILEAEARPSHEAGFRLSIAARSTSFDPLASRGAGPSFARKAGLSVEAPRLLGTCAVSGLEFGVEADGEATVEARLGLTRASAFLAEKLSLSATRKRGREAGASEAAGAWKLEAGLSLALVTSASRPSLEARAWLDGLASSPPAPGARIALDLPAGREGRLSLGLALAWGLPPSFSVTLAGKS